MTPNDIEILIHCHVSPAIHPRADAPAVRDALAGMQINELIEPIEGGGYATTQRGKAHVEQLCSLAWPMQIWLGANGDRIKI